VRSQEPFKTKKNCASSFSQFAVSANCHFVNFLFHQNAILTTCHKMYFLIKMSFCQFATMCIIYFYQSVILSTCQYMYFLLYSNAVLTTGSIINLPCYLLLFHHVAILSNCNFIKMPFNLMFCNLAILSTCCFINFLFNQNVILSNCQNKLALLSIANLLTVISFHQIAIW
jgi:hypothetical protein